MLRLGLCCIFRNEPIKFRTTTAAAIGRLNRVEGLAKLADIALANADALMAALRYCAGTGIGCFRINSQILPLKTHPLLGYRTGDLLNSDDIVRRFKVCRRFARKHDVRLCFHPDQFIVLNSQRPEVVDSSLAEIEYQAEVADLVGADVINIHGGGVFGDKRQALREFTRNVNRLSRRARRLLTVENDDRLFTPADLLPVCRETGIPLVYDVHHHRCNPDGLSEKRATEQALATWNREPLFHLSSPLEGWSGRYPQRHHDYIDVADFPRAWRKLDVTVEVEAKAKELAVLKLASDLNARRGRRTEGALR